MEEKWTQLKEKFSVSIPNKCHIIFYHLEEFSIRKNRPLGEFSEQVVESSHQKLKQIWEWYIVKDLESESHGENLLKCINHFNSFNVFPIAVQIKNKKGIIVPMNLCTFADSSAKYQVFLGIPNEPCPAIG